MIYKSLNLVFAVGDKDIYPTLFDDKKIFRSLCGICEFSALKVTRDIVRENGGTVGVNALILCNNSPLTRSRLADGRLAE